MNRTLKHRIYYLLEDSNSEGIYSQMLHGFIMSLIVLNVIAVILETVQYLATTYAGLFHTFELFSVFVFTIEYVARLWACTADPKYQHSLKGRIHFAATPFAIIDLITILPFFIPLPTSVDTRIIRGLRLVRLGRLFKLGRYSESLKTFGNVLSNKKEELITAWMMMLIMLVISSSLMYFVEHDTQPDQFSSIPASMWWGVSTLTTVGYGDVHPITPLGQFFGAIVALVGVGLFAMPTGILGSGFVEEMQKKAQVDPRYCPHCGKSVDGLILRVPPPIHDDAHD
ncbi:ion transporter [Anaerolineales bacterium HSG25]|nr:ion transporter [Anaerolineales bacterium HSG25]